MSVSACTGARASRPRDEPMPAAAPADSGTSASRDGGVADADPWQGASLIDRARARVGASSAVAWPGAGGFDDAVAFAGVSRVSASGAQNRVVSWYRQSEPEPTATAREYPVGSFAPTALDTLDVDGDGRPELLAFGDGATVQDGVTGTVLLFDLPAGRDQALKRIAESAALDGARDVAQVRARLPLSNGLAIADIGASSTLSVLGRLAFSSPAQLRAALAAGGAEVCAISREHGRTVGRQCHRLTTRATDAALRSEVRQRIENAFTESVLTFTCDTSARGETCHAQHAAGGQLDEFTFTGAGPARRLARVDTTDNLDAGE